MTNKKALSFFRGMKDKGVMVVFLQSLHLKVEKKENENDFESMDAFEKGKFHRTLQNLA